MGDERKRLGQMGYCARRNGKRGGWRTWLLVLAAVAAGVLLLSACETGRPTEAPTVVSAAATSTPEMRTATRPADTLTPVPTHTPLPTHTRAPTGTPSPEAPTDTPSPVPPTGTPLVPTATATRLPTDTPPPTATPLPPTATPLPPTHTPVPPPPTVPPPPQFPWRGGIEGTFSNCALTRLMGLTLDRNGGIAGQIWVRFWADGWEGAWTQSTWTVDEGYAGLDDSSNWDGVLATHAKPGTWQVCVVPAEGSRDCISPTVTGQTVAEPCAPDSGGVQILRFVFQQN